jgi:hypothetical protein
VVAHKPPLLGSPAPPLVVPGMETSLGQYWSSAGKVGVREQDRKDQVRWR